jgi:hypothetical protein
MTVRYRPRHTPGYRFPTSASSLPRTAATAGPITGDVVRTPSRTTRSHPCSYSRKAVSVRAENIWIRGISMLAIDGTS